MPKQQRSIGLNSDITRFVEEHRGSFSFSAYTEYLIREGIHTLQTKKPEARGSIDPRKDRSETTMKRMNAPAISLKPRLNLSSDPLDGASRLGLVSARMFKDLFYSAFQSSRHLIYVVGYSWDDRSHAHILHNSHASTAK